GGGHAEAGVDDGEGVAVGAVAAAGVDGLVGWGEDEGGFDGFGEGVGGVGGGGGGEGGGVGGAGRRGLGWLGLREGGASDAGGAGWVRRTGGGHLRGGSMPASTRRLSALRRMRVARWSRRKRLARVSGSVSLVSSSVMKSSCRPRRFWLRRPRLTKLSAMLRR